jgi:hypothetical protein
MLCGPAAASRALLCGRDPQAATGYAVARAMVDAPSLNRPGGAFPDGAASTDMTSLLPTAYLAYLTPTSYRANLRRTLMWCSGRLSEPGARRTRQRGGLLRLPDRAGPGRCVLAPAYMETGAGCARTATAHSRGASSADHSGPDRPDAVRPGRRDCGDPGGGPTAEGAVKASASWSTTRTRRC